MSAAQAPSDGAEGPMIGTLNEKSLHAALKAHYARLGDVVEAVVDGYVIDLVRDDLLIEVQTGNFAALKDKLEALLDEHRVLLVYPIAQTKWIVKVAADEGQATRECLSRRRSPKRGCCLDIFDELLRIPHLAGHPNLTLELVLCAIDEIRCDDGRGRWRRKGVSILDQELVDVLGTMRLTQLADFVALLPDDLTEPFTNRALAEAAGIRLRLAQRVTYALRHMGALQQVGFEGRAHLYRRAETGSPPFGETGGA
jgi:hypothetical protein